MTILAISHVMKSTGYEHQNHRFRVFRQIQPESSILLAYEKEYWPESEVNFESEFKLISAQCGIDNTTFLLGLYNVFGFNVSYDLRLIDI